MEKPIIRLEKLSISNLKNVSHGEVVFSNPRRPDGASVLGLYGQNGSGKSTMVDALEMAQQCMLGVRLDERFAQLVSVDADYGQVECELSVRWHTIGTVYRILYSFKVRSDAYEPEEVEDESNIEPKEGPRPCVFDERLAIASDTEGNKVRMTTLVDTAGIRVFKPSVKYAHLIGAGLQEALGLAVEKKLAYRESRSFVFSRALIRTIVAREKESFTLHQDAKDAAFAISALGTFARQNMFVLNARDSGMLALDTLPLPFRIANGERTLAGGIGLPMDGAKTIPERIYGAVTNVIENMNTVLRELIPGLEVHTEVLGTEFTRDGEKGISIQLVSKREGRTIPLSCESEGIKRIVSFLHLLILMFNDPSVTVVVDEIDSGVFEYLLGELLSIVSEHGQGQLIFTCHNLRPLETIDRGYVAFTTTNPNERYVRMTNVKSSNNLRDFYYRDIVLGGQKERLYEPTNNGEIELAFIEAGVAIEG